MSDPVDQVETLSGSDATGPPAAPAADEDAIPRVLGDRYLLEERIASGGMASVWRALDEVLARTVAVKVLHDHLAADDAFRERFRREAIAAAKLTHPNVVGLYDTGSDGDRVYLVMEYVDGVTLRDVIADLGTLETGQAAAVGEKVARALDYAHERGLVHRDVKPANILVADDGTVKVADFGIAKAEEAEDLTKTGMVLGTAAYVAPEQILTQPVDGRADQYALGCCLYEALTGRQPFKGESAVATAAERLERDPLPPRSVRAGVPRGLDAVVMRAMARDPEDRFPTAGALADALAPFADADAEETATLAAAAVTAHLPPVAELEPAARSAGAPPGPRAEPVRPPAAEAPDAGGGESFLRSEGRWLGPVLALLALAGVLVGVALATGVLEVDDVPILSARDHRPDGSAAEAQDVPPIAPAELRAFDPQGDGDENGRDLGALTDGDASTTWRTDLYNSAAFGGLKDGVGFWVDLGAPHRLESVSRAAAWRGIAYEVRVADQPAATLDGWRPVGSIPAAGGTDAVRITEPAPARYLLVWLNGNLQPDGRRYKAEFSALTVRGTPG